MKGAIMKKLLAVGIVAVVVFVSGRDNAYAGRHRASTPENVVTFSFFVQPLSFGLKHQVARNVFLTGNMDYLSSEEDLLFQTGAAYMIPRKVLFFRLYGGGGLEMSRNRGVVYPYLMVGTKFFFLFGEISHPLERARTPDYRFGFSFTF